MVYKKHLISIFILGILCIVGIAYNSFFACRIVVVGLFIFCLINGRNEQTIINPYYLFAVTPLSLMLYFNISDRYLGDLDVKTWLIAIINMGAFIAGLTLSRTKPKERLHDVTDNVSIGRHIVVLSALSFIPTYLYAFRSIALPFYSVLSLLYIPALVCAIYSGRKKSVVVILLLTVVPWTGNVSKMSILTLCLALIITYEMYHVLSSKDRIVIIILCVVAFIVMLYAFSFANQWRGAKTATSQVQYYTTYGGVMWSGNALLFMPYMYLTTPWANLQYVMQTQNIRTYGLWFLKPFISYLQLDGLFEQQYMFISKSSFNTYTFIAPHFKDFGFWGSIIPSFILGVFVKWVYDRAISTKRPLDVACYIYCAQATLQMFFSNHFFQQSYPFTIIILVALYRLLFCGYLRIGRR